LFWVKNANFFAEFFGENIEKIITSVLAGIFSNQKSQFGHIVEGFRMENVYIFYAAYLEYITAIRYV
jgi:hypothetical protein